MESHLVEQLYWLKWNSCLLIKAYLLLLHITPPAYHSSCISLILHITHPPYHSSSISLILHITHPPYLLILHITHPPYLLILHITHPPYHSSSISLILHITHPAYHSSCISLILHIYSSSISTPPAYLLLLHLGQISILLIVMRAFYFFKQVHCWKEVSLIRLLNTLYFTVTYFSNAPVLYIYFTCYERNTAAAGIINFIMPD